jgi:hypothetical protein
MNKKLNFKTSDEFKAYHNAFLSSTLSDRLSDKYKVRPFYERYAKLRAMVQNTSYLLNLFAIITSFTCVYTFVNTLLKNAPASFCCAVAFLVLLELFKRLTIPNTFKAYFQFRKIQPLKAVFIACLTITSVMLSFIGANEAVHTYTPTAALINTDSIQTQYNGRITTLEKRLKEIKRTQSWHGVLTPQGQSTYNATTQQIAAIENDRIATTTHATNRNDATTTTHATRTDYKAYYFSVISLLLDLLLIGFFYFMEYYDYRSFTEFTNLDSEPSDSDGNPTATQPSNEPPTNTSEPNKSTNEPSNNTVATVATENDTNKLSEYLKGLAKKKIQGNIDAYKAKLEKGEGKAETNQKGIERWENELSNLEKLTTNGE